MSSEGRGDVAAEVEALTRTLRSTLGPYGARKLVVEGDGTVSVTSSCPSILRRLDVDNPAVTVFRRAADGFAETNGDGATRLVVLVGALLDAAEALSERGVRPTAVERGYREASSVAVDRIAELERPLSVGGVESVAHTALTDVRDQSERRFFAGFVGQVVAELEAADRPFDAGNLAVAARVGGGRAESRLVHGVVLDRPPATSEMPRSPGVGGVAVLSETVDVPKLGGPTDRGKRRYSLGTHSFSDKRAFAERESDSFRERLETAVDAGCRVVVTGKAVNERVETVLANRGVLAIQRVDESDLRRLARATGATVVPGLSEVTPETLGRGAVRVTREAGRDMTVVESAGDQPVYTLYCRSPDPRSLDELRGSVEAALASVDSALETRTVVPGGGAAEMAAARTVARRARRLDGVEQLAAEAFGRALTAVPRTLASTTDLDGTTALVELRTAHAEGRDAVGVDCLEGETTDVLTVGDRPIVDPAALTRHVWAAATDLAVRLVRIDGRVLASGSDGGSTGESAENGGPASQS